MKTILIPLLLIPMLSKAQATPDSTGLKPLIVQQDSSAYLTLACQKRPTRHFKSRITKIRNGEKITVWDTFRKKTHGKLKVLNRNFFEITGRQGRKDTFSLGEVFQIKRLAPSERSGAVVLFTLGGMGIIGGTALASTPDSSGINLIGGAFLIILSVPFEILGAITSIGKDYKIKYYTFHIISN